MYAFNVYNVRMYAYCRYAQIQKYVQIYYLICIMYVCMYIVDIHRYNIMYKSII